MWRFPPMRWLVAAALFAGCAGMARAQDSRAAAVDGAPLKFEAGMDTWTRPAFEMKSGGDGVLFYNVTISPEIEKRTVTLESERITPTAAQWREFRHALDAVHVWGWRKDYENDNVLDGTAWSFEVEYADAKIRSTGSNAYPEADGSPDRNRRGNTTAPFKALMAAIGKLTGGLPFDSAEDGFSWHGEAGNLMQFPMPHLEFHEVTCKDALEFIRGKGLEDLKIIEAHENRVAALKFDYRFDKAKLGVRGDYEVKDVCYFTAMKGLLAAYGLDFEIVSGDTIVIRDKEGK